ncbi:TetR/AcrR family transcriptional regulator [Arthrobacter sp. NPDC090010]|uniref:TetR/AcrR family transcriptional regulator n=1 Tax=Arthrobacter sp. NPDC090010 TaxID=3363942 RepID=UPI0037FD2516
MARPVTHDAALRQQLLDATAELVAERGPSQVTLRELASAAGTSTTAIYALFGGKAQLLRAVVDHGFASFGAAQHAAAAGGLKKLGRAYREWALEHQALYRLMFGGLLSLQSECEGGSPSSDITQLPLLNAIRQGQGAGILLPAPAEEVAAIIWAQVHGMVSLEMARLDAPDTDWNTRYETALDSIERAWAV